MLQIHDLKQNEELDSQAMGEMCGGTSPNLNASNRASGSIAKDSPLRTPFQGFEYEPLTGAATKGATIGGSTGAIVGGAR